MAQCTREFPSAGMIETWGKVYRTFSNNRRLNLPMRRPMLVYRDDFSEGFLYLESEEVIQRSVAEDKKLYYSSVVFDMWIHFSEVEVKQKGWYKKNCDASIPIDKDIERQISDLSYAVKVADQDAFPVISLEDEDKDFVCDTDEEVEDIDDTIAEQEEYEKDTDYTQELADLAGEAVLPLGELVQKYAGAYSADFVFPKDESVEEEDDKTDNDDTDDDSSDEEIEDALKFLMEDSLLKQIETWGKVYRTFSNNRRLNLPMRRPMLVYRDDFSEGFLYLESEEVIQRSVAEDKKLYYSSVVFDMWIHFSEVEVKQKGWYKKNCDASIPIDKDIERQISDLSYAVKVADQDAFPVISLEDEDKDFVCDTDEEVEDIDDTIAEQEEYEKDTDYTQELADLAGEAVLPLGELVQKYAGAYSADFVFPKDESVEEEDDKTDNDDTDDDSSDEEIEDALKFLMEDSLLKQEDIDKEKARIEGTVNQPYISNLYWEARLQGFSDLQGKLFTHELLRMLFAGVNNVNVTFSTTGQDTWMDRFGYVKEIPIDGIPECDERGDGPSSSTDKLSHPTLLETLKHSKDIEFDVKSCYQKVTPAVTVTQDRVPVLIATVVKPSDDPAEQIHQLHVKMLLHLTRQETLFGLLVHTHYIDLIEYSYSRQEYGRMYSGKAFKYSKKDLKLLYYYIRGQLNC